VPASAAQINVEDEEKNPDSLLAWYRSLIRLKKTTAALERGSNTMLDTGNDKVLSWMRQAPGAPAVVVSANFTAEPQTVDLSSGMKGNALRTLLKSPGGADSSSLKHIELAPFGVYIGEVR
jgi:alpha-glucosidase